MYNRTTSSRLTNIMFTTQSLASTSQIAIFTLLSIVAVELSGNEGFAGLPSTLLTLARALAALPIGILMGRFGRRFGLTLSYGSAAIGALLGVLAIVLGWFPLLLVSGGFLGMGRAGADQSRFAAGELFEEKDRARMIGRVVFAGTMGAIGGPLLVKPSVALATFIGLDPNVGPWLMGLGFYILASFITFSLLRPEPMTIARLVAGEEKKKKVDAVDIPARSILTLLKIPAVQLAVVSMLISQVVMTTLMVITPLHMSHHNHDSGGVSLVIMAHTLGMFGLSSLTGRLIDRYGRVAMLVTGAFTLVAATIISPLSTTLPVLMIGLFLLGLGWNFGYIAGSSLLADALKGEESSRMQGANDMLVAGAAAVGSFSSGFIFSSGGYVAVAGVGLILTVLFGWIIWLLAPGDIKVQQA